MDLAWLDREQPDRRDIDGAAAVMDAANAVDTPHFLPDTTSSVLARLRHGGDGDPPAMAVAQEGGRVVGMVRVALPRWDNTHLSVVRVVVDPRVRRRGLGRGLFEAGVERARAEGRRVVAAWTLERAAGGVEFLKAMGLDVVATEVLRRQDVLAIDWPRLDRYYADALPLAAGYQLLRLPGPVPEELLPRVATMTEAINDAPFEDLELENEVFSPERIRAFEAAMTAHGSRLYRVVARHRDTGELAGHTLVGVENERPGYGWQGDTSVVRAHRGHRLGLLLKIEMLRWLRQDEPQLRLLDTGNNNTNAHMIRINEQLGYEVIDKIIECQRRLEE
jgi:GNAT superfamily N-acetyltransferase